MEQTTQAPVARRVNLAKLLGLFALAVLLGLWVATEVIGIGSHGLAALFGGHLFGSVYVPWAIVKWVNFGILSVTSEEFLTAASAGIVTALLVLLLPTIFRIVRARRR